LVVELVAAMVVVLAAGSVHMSHHLLKVSLWAAVLDQSVAA